MTPEQKRAVCIDFARHLNGYGFHVTLKHVDEFCRTRKCVKCGESISKYGDEYYCWTERCKHET